MNLEHTLRLYAGGSGSGCDPDEARRRGNRCGRPPGGGGGMQPGGGGKAWKQPPKGVWVRMKATDIEFIPSKKEGRTLMKFPDGGVASISVKEAERIQDKGYFDLYRYGSLKEAGKGLYNVWRAPGGETPPVWNPTKKKGRRKEFGKELTPEDREMMRQMGIRGRAQRHV